MPTQLVAVDEIPQAWINFVIPAPAIEDTIVPDTGLHVVRFHVRTDAAAHVLRRHGLAYRANIVLLSLHSEQGGAANRCRFDGAPQRLQLAQRQCMILEHALHRFQVKLGGQIRHCEILGVESLDGVGFFHLPFDQVVIQVLKGLHMPLQVHVHERGQLQETGIDLALATSVTAGNGADQVFFKPVDRLAFGQMVDRGWIDAGIDRTGHQRHAGGLRRMAFRGHQ